MNTETTCVEKQPLTDAYLEKMNAYWRAVSHGMTRKSELYGPSLPAPITAPRPETAIALMTARSCYSAIRISCGRD